jgi:outer membrane murein-binding lipoprotein Lpp
MAYDRESILQQYPKEITHILKATTADQKDEAARLKVATTLAKALSFTGIRTGENRTPQDTEVYKLAAAIRRAKSREQFETALQQAIPKAKSRILEKYNLVWNLPWSTEREQGQESRKRRTRKAEVSEPVPDVNARIDALENAMKQIRSQLSDLQLKIEPSGTRMAKQLDEVLQKLKAHQHDREDGKGYILEKKEI